MNDLVSVVMPVYNAGVFLKEAVQSVVSQTYPHWELLIIDDCSTDDSVAIIRKFMEQDSRIRYYKTDKPSGSPTLPRNIGIEKACGRYIAFLDSDDVWLPEKLEQQLPLFERADTVIVFSDYEKISEQSIRNHRVVSAPAIVDYRKLLYGNVIGCSTAVYDTEKTGKIFFEYVNHEDYILWLSILKKGGVARNTGTVNTLYRVRKRSVSSNKRKAMSWQWHIYTRVEKVGYIRAAYYFIHYAYKAYRKSRI